MCRQYWEDTIFLNAAEKGQVEGHQGLGEEGY